MLSTLFANIRFELAIRYRSLSTYLYFAMFFILALMMGLATGGAFGGVTVSFGLSNKVFLNSNLAITMFMGLLGSFSLFIISPTFGQAVVKDYANKFDQIIYSTPISQKIFLISRFISALLFMLFVMTSLALGLWLSSILPFILKTTVTTNSLANYIVPYFTIVLPNIFVFGSIAFFTATRTKTMGPVYILGILMFIGWMLSGSLIGDLDNKMIATLADPFGIQAVGELTKYWSADQQNTRIVYWEGYLLYNRILWCGLGLAAFFLSLSSFTFSAPIRLKKAATPNAPIAAPSLRKNFESLSQAPTITVNFWSMLWAQTKLEYKQVLRSIYFRTLVLAGVGYMFVAGEQVGKMFGTNTYPVTYAVLDLVGGSFDLFILIILTFFAGEVVWRDRDHKLQQVIDSYPVPSTSLIFAKLLNLALVALSLLGMVIVCGVLIQLFRGYTHLELGLYFTHLYSVRFFTFINVIILAVFFQTMLNNKFLAHGAMIVYYILYTWASSMGFEHKLYTFNAATRVIYSDMNGYGHFLPGYYLFKSYWFFLSLVLLAATILFWQRGNLTAWADRKKEALRRFTKKIKTLTVTASLGFIGLGGFLFYDTNIRNSYTTEKQQEIDRIDYEKKYSARRYEPQLENVAVKAFVDIFPKDIKANIKYVNTLKNKTIKAISTIMLEVPRENQKIVTFDIQFNVPVILERNDAYLGIRFYKFETPVPAGATIEMTYSATVERKGIPNSKDITNIVENGTFFNNTDYSFAIGYNKWNEITETKTREKYGMAKRQRLPDITDAQERRYTYISSNSTWLDFEATVSTDPDQIAIAPGYLQKEWSENNRRYFHYKMDQKILNFFAFLSARYVVKRDKWNDVNIEIYYHPTHTYNVDKMIDASKHSLEYFTKNFGPYQHKQYRVLEFPRYETFAQAFPNTIPFSEAVGFIAHVDPNNPKDVDYPFYITSHELAHQWWAHQVIGGNVQGATMLSESFSQYSALMAMEKRFGREKMKRFLRYELDRYLSGRGNEDEYEQPLYLNENQMYIHYQKGSLALYGLKEYIGEDVLNSALKAFLEKTKFQESPFTVSTEFLEILKDKTPKNLHPIVEDLLEKIVLFDNKPQTATYKPLEDGKFEVQLKINTQKWYSDKNGKETTAEFVQTFDIGITDDKDNYLYLKKHAFKNGDNSFTIVVDKLPAKAGVDPLNYIIDRTPDDNMMSVSTL